MQRIVNRYNGWGWLGDLFKIIFAAIGVGLALWFLWWLFNQKPRNGSVGGGRSSGPTAPPFVASSSTKTANSSRHEDNKTVSEEKTGYEGAIALIAQLQKTGGNVSFGDLKVEIPAKGINININNSGSIAGAGIKIDAVVSETDVFAESTHYHKTTGGQQKEKKPDEKRPDSENQSGDERTK